MSAIHSQSGPLHVVDQVILDVARRFRFTVAEVKEYYDRCGDLNRTTNRFARMREVLTNLPDDDQPSTLTVTPTIVNDEQLLRGIM